MRKIVFLVLALAAVHTNATQRPNILLLMSEDMSSRVGAFGDTVAVTPNLDALAQAGVRYTNTFTTAGVCAPSRAAHILGMYQIATGAQHMRTSSRPEGGYYAVPPGGVKAYPELLRAAGYYTYTDQKLDYQFSGPFPGSGPFTIWDSEGEAAPDWRGRAQGQPFFGLRNFGVTHESGVFTPLGSLPHSFMHFVMQVARWWRMDEEPTVVVDPESVVVPPYYPDTETVRRDMARHYNNIAFMDAEVGAILEQLEADGLADSTIVIWTTDHGDGLPRAKRELFDSGIKVPMIIRWPEAFRPAGVEPGAVDARLISFVDLAPTILELAGVEAPPYLQGRDFVSPDTPRRRYIYAARDRIDEVPDRQRAVRDQRFKYIRSWYPEQAEGHELAFRDNLDMVREMRDLYRADQLSPAQARWFEPVGKERLFDVVRDPFELRDLSNSPAHAKPLERMRAELLRRLNRFGDWSVETEEEMVTRFNTGGERPVTPAPVIRVRQGVVTLVGEREWHSIGYRIDGGVWRVYSQPFALDGGEMVEAKAVRYGWQESEVQVR